MSKTAMKNSPQEYAEMLIEKHVNIKSAIIDVTNTIGAIKNITDKYYFIEVLTILKSKL